MISGKFLDDIEIMARGEKETGSPLSRKMRIFLLLSILSLFLCSSGPAWAAPTLPTIKHRVLLNPTSALPSAIAVVTNESAVASIRALMILDNRLLTIPLQFLKDYRGFRGQFPTPKENLSYQFQIILKDGTSFVTEQYRITPSCKTAENAQLLDEANSFPEQRELLEAALRYESNAAVLKYLLSTIPDIIQREKIKW